MRQPLDRSYGGNRFPLDILFERRIENGEEGRNGGRAVLDMQRMRGILEATLGRYFVGGFKQQIAERSHSPAYRSGRT